MSFMKFVMHIMLFIVIGVFILFLVSLTIESTQHRLNRQITSCNKNGGRPTVIYDSSGEAVASTCLKI